MMTVISYCHKITDNDEFVVDDHLVYLLVPLLSVFKDACSRGDSKTLVEHYIALLVTVRPDLFPDLSPLVAAPPESSYMQVFLFWRAHINEHEYRCFASMTSLSGGI